MKPSRRIGIGILCVAAMVWLVLGAIGLIYLVRDMRLTMVESDANAKAIQASAAVRRFVEEYRLRAVEDNASLMDVAVAARDAGLFVYEIRSDDSACVAAVVIGMDRAQLESIRRVRGSAFAMRIGVASAVVYRDAGEWMYLIDFDNSIVRLWIEE